MKSTTSESIQDSVTRTPQVSFDESTTHRNLKQIICWGGGTFSDVANHLSLAAPAFGGTAKMIGRLFNAYLGSHLTKSDPAQMDVVVNLTRMAGGAKQVHSAEDLRERLQYDIDNPRTKIIVWTCAVCDFDAQEIIQHGDAPDMMEEDANVTIYEAPFDRQRRRLKSSLATSLNLKTAPKLVGEIRKTRKDIFLVAFKTTCGATSHQQYLAGLKLCKEASCNLVVVNDVRTRNNMIVTPEEAVYHESYNRLDTLTGLVEMTIKRSQLTFTRSTVTDGKPVGWSSENIPLPLMAVVDHLRKNSAYKSFLGSTVGHFAFRESEDTFVTSIRRTNFNNLDKIGMVRIKTDGPDTVLAYGAKPSVGGQSQRIVFLEHEGFDCIVHFHCPLRPHHPDDIPVVSQREFECGSHECGNNTSKGLRQFGNLKAVMLDQHGPNIVFPRHIDPEEVILFIERNFDTTLKTGGYQLPPEPTPEQENLEDVLRDLYRDGIKAIVLQENFYEKVLRHKLTTMKDIGLSEPVLHFHVDSNNVVLIFKSPMGGYQDIVALRGNTPPESSLKLRGRGGNVVDVEPSGTFHKYFVPRIFEAFAEKAKQSKIPPVLPFKENLYKIVEQHELSIYEEGPRGPVLMFHASNLVKVEILKSIHGYETWEDLIDNEGLSVMKVNESLYKINTMTAPKQAITHETVKSGKSYVAVPVSVEEELRHYSVPEKFPEYEHQTQAGQSSFPE